MEYKYVLLTGASGTLGKKIVSLNKLSNILAPARDELDITKPVTIKQFFDSNNIDAIIHCAAMARMRECYENPDKAIETNIVGTCNLIEEIIRKGKKNGRSIRFVHMSTDGVYGGTRGNYSETAPTIPFNLYGWTKLGAECAVKALENYCIIRTNFFEPEKIKFKESAIDAFTSKVTVEYAAKAVITMLNHGFTGTINIGKERMSDYDNYKKYKPSIKPCKLKDILKTVPFPIAQDFSMDISLWKKVEKEGKA